MSENKPSPSSATVSNISRRVLVLDKTGKPVSTTKLLRALRLAAQKTRVVVVESDPPASDGDSPTPSVIQLLDLLVNMAIDIELRPNRHRIFLRDGHTCQYCGQKKSTRQLTLDHVMPQSRGGEDTWENLVAACFRCNNLKANRTPEEAGMKLQSPKKPVTNLRIEALLHGKPDDQVKTWLRYFRAGFRDSGSETKEET